MKNQFLGSNGRGNGITHPTQTIFVEDGKTRNGRRMFATQLSDGTTARDLKAPGLIILQQHDFEVGKSFGASPSSPPMWGETGSRIGPSHYAPRPIRDSQNAKAQGSKEQTEQYLPQSQGFSHRARR